MDLWGRVWCVCAGDELPVLRRGAVLPLSGRRRGRGRRQVGRRPVRVLRAPALLRALDADGGAGGDRAALPALLLPAAVRRRRGGRLLQRRGVAARLPMFQPAQRDVVGQLHSRPARRVRELQHLIRRRRAQLPQHTTTGDRLLTT